MIALLKKRVVARNLSLFSVMLLARVIGNSCLRREGCNVSTKRAFMQLVGTVVSDSSRCLKKRLSSTPLENWTDISFKELKAMIQSDNIQLIDVRESFELVQVGKIPCSTNIPCTQS